MRKAAIAVLSLLCALALIACGGKGKEPQTPSTGAVGAVSELTLKNGVLNWSPADNAESYEIVVNGQTITTVAPGKDVKSVLTAEGSYTFTVHGVKGEEKGPDATYTVTATKLAKPAVTVDAAAGTFTVAEVANAKGYSYSWMEDGVFVAVDTDTMTINAPAGEGTYKAYVKAIGNLTGETVYLDSDVTVSDEIAVKSRVTVIFNEQTGVLTFDEIDGADSYDLWVDGEKAITGVTSGVNLYTGSGYKLPKTGIYTAYVVANKGGEEYSRGVPRTFATTFIGENEITTFDNNYALNASIKNGVEVSYVNMAENPLGDNNEGYAAKLDFAYGVANKWQVNGGWNTKTAPFKVGTRIRFDVYVVKPDGFVPNKINTVGALYYVFDGTHSSNSLVKGTDSFDMNLNEWTTLYVTCEEGPIPSSDGMLGSIPFSMATDWWEPKTDSHNYGFGEWESDARPETITVYLDNIFVDAVPMDMTSIEEESDVVFHGGATNPAEGSSAAFDLTDILAGKGVDILPLKYYDVTGTFKMGTIFGDPVSGVGNWGRRFEFGAEGHWFVPPGDYNPGNHHEWEGGEPPAIDKTFSYTVKLRADMNGKIKVHLMVYDFSTIDWLAATFTAEESADQSMTATNATITVMNIAGTGEVDDGSIYRVTLKVKASLAGAGNSRIIINGNTGSESWGVVTKTELQAMTDWTTISFFAVASQLTGQVVGQTIPFGISVMPLELGASDTVQIEVVSIVKDETVSSLDVTTDTSFIGGVGGNQYLFSRDLSELKGKKVKVSFKLFIAGPNGQGDSPACGSHDGRVVAVGGKPGGFSAEGGANRYCNGNSGNGTCGHSAALNPFSEGQWISIEWTVDTLNDTAGADDGIFYFWYGDTNAPAYVAVADFSVTEVTEG